MSTFSCQALTLSGKDRGNFCGKPSKYYIDIQNNRIHLCTYHNTRYRKQQRLALQIEENMEIKIITIPDFGICSDYGIKEKFSKKRPADYLPNDCWSIILNYLPEASKLMCKFVCKNWNVLLKDNKTKEIDFYYEFMSYGCVYRNYFEQLATYYGIHNINVDNFGYGDIGIWLINKGAKFTEKALASAIYSSNYDLLNLLIKKGCKYTNPYTIYTKLPGISGRHIKDDIINILTENNIMFINNEGNLEALL